MSLKYSRPFNKVIPLTAITTSPIGSYVVRIVSEVTELIIVLSTVKPCVSLNTGDAITGLSGSQKETK